MDPGNSGWSSPRRRLSRRVAGARRCEVRLKPDTTDRSYNGRMPVDALHLQTLIHGGNHAAIQDALLHLTPREAAEAIVSLPPEDRLAAFAVLPHRPAAALFEYMPEAAQQALDGSDAAEGSRGLPQPRGRRRSDQVPRARSRPTPLSTFFPC